MERTVLELFQAYQFLHLHVSDFEQALFVSRRRVLFEVILVFSVAEQFHHRTFLN